MWNTKFNVSFDTLKEKLESAPILVYPDWSKEFHVHIDVWGIFIGAVLMQIGEGNLDHPIYFTSRKISTMENNHTNVEYEALTIVYSLQNFKHYFLGGPFKFFTNNFYLKYLVNEIVLKGRICKWLLLFQ